MPEGSWTPVGLSAPPFFLVPQPEHCSPFITFSPSSCCTPLPCFRSPSQLSVQEGASSDPLVEESWPPQVPPSLENFVLHFLASGTLNPNKSLPPPFYLPCPRGFPDAPASTCGSPSRPAPHPRLYTVPSSAPWAPPSPGGPPPGLPEVPRCSFPVRPEAWKTLGSFPAGWGG